jgi:hypothetical protein
MTAPAKKQRSQKIVWTWRMPLPMPWGEGLEQTVQPVQLLELPLAFTQNGLLSPDDFVKRAGERGVQLTVGHLHELHCRRALVPLLRITQHLPKSCRIVEIPASAAHGYNQFRSPIALVIAAAQQGYLMDPGPAPFRRWDGGLPLPTWGRVHRYPSVFYSPYQLLALGPVQGLIGAMTSRRAADRSMTYSLDPLTPDEVLELDGCRQLAIVLSTLDMRYLPRILRTAHHGEWEKEDPGFSALSRLELLDLAPEALAATATALLNQARFRDPLGPWYDLIRQADPGAWSQLRGDALLAMDYRIAAEILLRTLDDLGRTDLSAPPPRSGRMYRTNLDDRLQPEPERLEEVLSERGLSPRPAVLLVLEGETEMDLMPRVLAEIYGKPVPATLIETVDMKTIDRDLDLLVRHEAGPRLGADHGASSFWPGPPPACLSPSTRRGGSQPRPNQGQAARRPGQVGSTPARVTTAAHALEASPEADGCTRPRRHLGNRPLGVRRRPAFARSPRPGATACRAWSGGPTPPTGPHTLPAAPGRMSPSQRAVLPADRPGPRPLPGSCPCAGRLASGERCARAS